MDSELVRGILPPRLYRLYVYRPLWSLPHELISKFLTGIGCDCAAADTKVLEKETFYKVLGSSNNPTFTCLQILTLFTTLQDSFWLLICACFFRKPRVISIYQDFLLHQPPNLTSKYSLPVLILNVVAEPPSQEFHTPEKGPKSPPLH